MLLLIPNIKRYPFKFSNLLSLLDICQIFWKLSNVCERKMLLLITNISNDLTVRDVYLGFQSALKVEYLANISMLSNTCETNILGNVFPTKHFQIQTELFATRPSSALYKYRYNKRIEIQMKTQKTNHISESKLNLFFS